MDESKLILSVLFSSLFSRRLAAWGFLRNQVNYAEATGKNIPEDVW